MSQYRTARPVRSVQRSSGRSRRLWARRALLAGALVVVAVTALLLLRPGGGAEPNGTVDAFAVAWTHGNDAAAGRLTDAPATATAGLRASRAGLDGATVTARVRDIRRHDDTADATLGVRWNVPGFGAFAYDTKLALHETDDKWTIRWRPADIHPKLTRQTRLGTAVETPRRGEILDRQGRGIVRPRVVYDVAVDVDRVRDPSATASELGDLLHIDAGALARTLHGAPEGRFIPVLTLRAADYHPLASRLAGIRGISIARSKLSLAPTRDFARALLGTVGPATAEQVKREHRSPGEMVGQSGVEAAFQDRLAGEPTRSIVVRDRDSGGAVATLAAHRGHTGKPLHTTLDLDVQSAAEQALSGVTDNAALVAVQASTGDILAVANRPADSTYDRALLGLYPPGSTFKVVVTDALLRTGLDVDTPVACPPTISVQGKSFHNFEGEAAGQVPFYEDFAQSCNTAFVSLAGRLDADALPSTAREFGLGRKARPGVQVADSRVPPGRSAVEQAAMMIGQDRIVASPLTLAGMAATVADGRWHAPRLLADDPRATGEPLPSTELATLRSLMRRVVTSGTGNALAGVPGEPAGKSGTAEYGSGDPPPTHAWFVAYRGDIAVAALVENGSSGGAVAAPLVASFYEALGG